MRNLYADQEATVWTRFGMTDWFQIGKEVHHGCILTSMQMHHANARLEQAEAGVKIAGRNINNLMQMKTPLWQKVKKN